MSSLTRAPVARRPTLGLAIVLGLHVAFVYALMAGIGFRQPLVVQPPPVTIIPDPTESRPVEPLPRPVAASPYRNSYQPALIPAVR